MRDAPDKVNPGDRSAFAPTDAVTVRLPRWALALIVESLDESSNRGAAEAAAGLESDDERPSTEALVQLSRSIQLVKLADSLRGNL